ncbi:MAG: hypothetical protein ABL974_01570 [Prosthecobacter sp.]
MGKSLSGNRRGVYIADAYQLPLQHLLLTDFGKVSVASLLIQMAIQHTFLTALSKSIRAMKVAEPRLLDKSLRSQLNAFGSGKIANMKTWFGRTMKKNYGCQCAWSPAFCRQHGIPELQR